MATPRTIINAALRSIGITDAAATPDAPAFNDGIEAANLLLDTWSIQRLRAFDYDKIDFALEAYRKSYTIGPSAVAGDPDGIGTGTASQTSIAITGAHSTLGASPATFDVPRQIVFNCVLDESAKVFTVTGTDVLGNALVEVINGLTGVGVSGGRNVYGEKLFKTITTITCTALAGTVLVGSASLVNTARPNKVIDAFIRSSANADTPVLPTSRMRYNEKSDKFSVDTPSEYYYDHSYPNGVIFFYKTPSAALRIYMDVWQPFAQFAVTNYDTTVNLPNAYARALKWNVAVELAPEYGKDIPQIVAANAISSQQMIDFLNSTPEKILKSTTPMDVVGGQPAINQR